MLYLKARAAEIFGKYSLPFDISNVSESKITIISKISRFIKIGYIFFYVIHIFFFTYVKKKSPNKRKKKYVFLRVYVKKIHWPGTK